MKRLLPLFVTVSVLVSTAAMCAPDWPQWRGLARDGVAVASLPKAWPQALPAPKWRVPVGEGFSSPVIADGRVFILGRPAAGQESCYAFDAATGKRLWQQSYPCDFKPPDNSAGPGPNSTPTVDGDRVYMQGLHGMFHCLDVRTGKILWKHDFAREYWGVQKDEHGSDAWFPPCGTAASPLVVGEHVIVPVGGKKAGAFTAFDRKTGEIAWKALEDRSSYASPLTAELAGVKQLVGFTGLRMVGLGLADRKLAWEYPFPAAFEQTIVTPVVWKDLVIVSGEGRPTVALQISKAGEGLAQAVKWQSPQLRAYMASPIVVKDHLIGVDHFSRRLVCLDLATGARTWESSRLGSFATLVNAGEQVLALNNQGDLLVFEANPREFKAVGQWKVSEAGGTWAHLAVVGNRLYVKDKEHLLCLELAGTPANARR